MKLIFEQSKEAVMNNIHTPEYAHPNEDSGMDVYCPEKVVLKSKELKTINVHVRFEIKVPILFKILNFFGVGIGCELQVRGKSGRDKAGISVAFGTGDETYKGWYQINIRNFSNKTVIIEKNEKICQMVLAPVFNKVKLVNGFVDLNSGSRGDGGFGSTGLNKKK